MRALYTGPVIRRWCVVNGECAGQLLGQIKNLEFPGAEFMVRIDRSIIALFQLEQAPDKFQEAACQPIICQKIE